MAIKYTLYKLLQNKVFTHDIVFSHFVCKDELYNF